MRHTDPEKSETSVPDATELRAALEPIALQLEYYSDRAHLDDLVKFARDMAGPGRPGFSDYVRARAAAAH